MLFQGWISDVGFRTDDHSELLCDEAGSKENQRAVAGLSNINKEHIISTTQIGFAATRRLIN